MAVQARRAGVVVCLLGVLAACGGDGGAGSTTSTTAPGTTATTVATTVTATLPTTATTSAPDDAHPSWGVGWADLWPPDGSTATVRATSDEGTVDARIGVDYGVAWDEGTWDRIWLGSPDHGSLGVSFYLQRPEPWVLRLWGAETYGAGGFVITERFDPPVTLDLRLAPGEGLRQDTTVVISTPDGVVDEGPYSLSLTVVGFEAVDVAAGRFEDTARVHLVAAEPGGLVAETDLWLAQGAFLVRLEPAHIWRSLELVSPWSG